MEKQFITIWSSELKKAMKDIKEAEKNGFMYCKANFSQSPGCNERWIEGTYLDITEKAHPTDGNLDWGRGQDVTKRNKFKNGKLIPLKSSIEKHDHVVSAKSIFKIQVCSRGTEDEALEWVRLNHPAGTTNNWMREREEKYKPVECDDYKDRTHYVFSC